MERFSDRQLSFKPVLALRPDGVPVDSSYWDQFATKEEGDALSAFLIKSGVPFQRGVDTTVTVLPGEDRVPYTYTIAGETLDFGQVASVVWRDGVPGKAYVVDPTAPGFVPDPNNGTVLRFKADPPPPPPPPPPVPTAFQQMSNQGGLQGFDMLKAVQEMMLNFRNNPNWLRIQ